VPGRRLDDAASEGLDPRNGRREAVGKLIGVRVDPQAERRADRLAPRAQTAERRHPARASSTGGSRRATSGLALASA
jgi:hypothetical protein